MSETPAEQKLILVTGPSGAGRSTAISALEDLGVETIDNLPLSLLPRLLEGPPLGRTIALGVDVRNRDFTTSGLIAIIDGLTCRPDVTLEVLYLDCRADVLVRRYSETRRRHPLVPAQPPLVGVQQEMDLLVPIKARADFLLDTSELTPHDLKQELVQWLGATPAQRMSVSVQSFSYKRGVPRGIDLVFDCRFLRNPHWVPELRSLNGRDAPVAAYVQQDPRFAEFFQRVSELIQFLLPAHLAEGKAHLSIGFGCSGGQHRSVAVVEKLGDTLETAGWQISRRHRELERMQPKPEGAPAMDDQQKGGV